ncbi:class I SAM-dependent methyltransferase [bacterium]|nr:MAG: class I SAM-dependent methyltransferase [bacterium]
MKYQNGEMYDRSTRDTYRKLWYEMVERYLDMYLPKEGRVLDAGGGTGEFCIRAAKLRPKLSFINFDISKNMLTIANKKLSKLGLESRMRCQEGDIMNMPFEENSFDYVMCLGDALSFCSDAEKALSELSRVMADKGLLHISVNAFWGNFAIMIGKGVDAGFTFEDIKNYYDTHLIHQHGVSTDCRSFTFQELEDIGKRNGLICIKAFATPVFPVHNDLLAADEKYEYMCKLQYRHCEDEHLIDFGNHINVIYEK